MRRHGYHVFATGTSQAATTIATAVEIFRLWLPSPPVPHTSIAPSGAEIVFILLRISRTAAAISTLVSSRSDMTDRKCWMSSGATAPSRDHNKGFSRQFRSKRLRRIGQEFHTRSFTGIPAMCMKLASMACRYQWRCFPDGTVGSVACRNPMTWPSSLVALTTSCGGMFSTISEWYRVAVKGEGRPANKPDLSCVTGDVLPCIKPPRETVPPKCWPIV